MGTELTRRGSDTSLPLWSARALKREPDLVRQIHRDYVEAGADVITTNTFRTKRRTLERAGGDLDWRELTSTAVELARKAASARRGVKVAGSISPLEDCYRPDLSPGAASFDEHLEMARHLADCGCDLLLVETMGTRDEAVAATRAARDTGLEVWVGVMAKAADCLYSGEPLGATVRALVEEGPKAILVNCSTPAVTDAAIDTVAVSAPGIPRGAYPNAGVADDVTGWRSDASYTPERLALDARTWIGRGATIVGGCCGTTPPHIKAVAKLRGKSR
ncbi:MAG: homocysteine S-methyltransferase family protein [Euryarchaeota archaeon]|nr:homocysteine S-methyltransferase family protein [Euryarchaeota archaeon]